MATDLTLTYNSDDDADRLILVDCNGTLFLPSLNAPLFDMIDAAKQSGEYRVVVFSDDPSGNQTTLELAGLKRHRDKGYYGEVAAKSEYTGRKAFLVIDDNHASHMVDTALKGDPANAKALEKMTFWLTQGVQVVDQAIRDIQTGVPPGIKPH